MARRGTNINVQDNYANPDARTWEDDVLITLGVLKKRTATRLDSKLQKASPVDTGLFRNNWQWSFSGFPSGTVSLGGSRGVNPAGRGNLETGRDDIFLANNLDYAEKLNSGGSTQAQRKFVEIAMQEALNEAFGL